MTRAEDVQRAFDEVLSDGVRRGMMHNAAEDRRLDGQTVRLRGRTLVNFGSCSYLGLETHPDMVAAVTEAVRRYGTQFASSRTYLSAPAYPAAEEAFSALFGRSTMITSSTSLGHQAAMTALMGSRDVLILDHQVHASVQVAARLAQAQGTAVELIPHLDLRTLERRIREYRTTHRRIWYAMDGVFSMYADLAPIGALNDLVEQHECLRLYIDDAHGFSWTGRDGRGYALERLSPLAWQRSIVAGSLNKSFAAAGGAITFADPAMRTRAFTIGGPMIFSGPVQPPMLGALLASARLHTSDEVAVRQRRLLDLIRLFNRLADECDLPLVSATETPIRCVAAGPPQIAYQLCAEVERAGYYVNAATYPAVAAKRSGARIAINANHSETDIHGIVEALASALPRVLAEAGSDRLALARAFGRSLANGLRLEHHETAADVEPAWDRLFAGCGALDRSSLLAFERVFAPSSPEPEHRWRFDYWLVRDRSNRIVAATFTTTALWKSDMLSTEAVSDQVERLRRRDRYHLTTTMVSTGCLITEANHVYLDRSAAWRPALGMLLAGMRRTEAETGASGIAVRDLPDDDPQLHEYLIGEGFARTPMLDSWVCRVDFGDDRRFLASLPKKARYHQRAKVLGRQDAVLVKVLAGGSAEAVATVAAARDLLYRLYRNVHARRREINVYPLPARLLDAVAGTRGWELALLELAESPGTTVAFCAQHVDADAVQPVFVGLDYRYVASHGTYQQLLMRSLRSARRSGATTVLYGMSAGLQKSRFGALPQRRWVYTQTTELFDTDLLNQVTERLNATGPWNPRETPDGL